MKKSVRKHMVNIVLTLVFVCCTIFIFPHSIGRIIESIRDMGISLVDWFCKLVGIETGIEPTVTKLPKYPFFDFIKKGSPDAILPDTYKGFKDKWSGYWDLFISKDNTQSYYRFLLGMVNNLSYIILMFLVPLIITFRMMFSRYMYKENNKYNKDSTPLKIYKCIHKKVVVRIVDGIKEQKEFTCERSYYLKIWKWIWLINFNIISIIVSFFAYYMYFSISFDIGSIYIQVYKLFLDISVPIRFIPIWCWLIVGIYMFSRMRERWGLAVLYSKEMHNQRFIRMRALLIFITGTVGTSKTTMLTDMILSQEVIFRKDAMKMLLEIEMKFSDFPWINLENEIKKRMNLGMGERGRIYTLVSCKRFIKESKARWEKKRSSESIFGYDYKKKKMSHDDGLKLTSLWEALESYTKLYFIYRSKSPLVYSNYSIRTDGVQRDRGNFPIWDLDFFGRDSRKIDLMSNYAHIINFDMLRPGRKVNPQNKYKDVYEFGSIAVTEMGKERYAHGDVQRLDRNAIEANQKNDLLPTFVKMIRHPSVIEGYAFCRVIIDEQRQTSLDPDLRGLMEMVHIRESSDIRLSLPFYGVGELLHYIIFGRFSAVHREYRFARGDNTLLMHIIKSLSSKLHNHHTRIYNRFGYKKLTVELESGAQEGTRTESTYYIMLKKDWSKRFATGCFSDVFNKKAERSMYGINDMPQYKSVQATDDEMRSQDSYFMRDLDAFD